MAITPLRLLVVLTGLSAAFYFGFLSNGNSASLGLFIGLIMAAILGYLIKINK